MYASTLCAYQPLRGPDMLAYLHVIASAHEEFHFAVCMAYDVAFRKKAANFILSSWGHIDPQIYSYWREQGEAKCLLLPLSIYFPQHF